MKRNCRSSMPSRPVFATDCTSREGGKILDFVSAFHQIRDVAAGIGKLGRVGEVEAILRETVGNFC
jgi:hypothetical protein